MKILVIGLEGVDSEFALRDERLTTLRGLMEAGCHGPLEGAPSTATAPPWTWSSPAIWERVAAANGRSILVDVPPEDAPRQMAGVSIVSSGVADASVQDAGRNRFSTVRRLMAEGAWDYLQVVDDGIDRLRRAEASAEAVADYGVLLDRKIAETLELLGDDVIVLIASIHDDPTKRGAFILAGSRLPPFGEIDGVGVLDVAPTLLALADLPPLPQAAGRNFLEGREPIDPAAGAPDLDDDELVRERLRGLGYIG